MKAPETVQDFKALLKDMQHRERFVFNYQPKDINDKNPTVLEVYATEVGKFVDLNICFTVVNGNKNKPQNKLFKLLTQSDLENVWNRIY